MSLKKWSTSLESDSCSASLEFLSIQWNMKVKPCSQEGPAGSYPDESDPHTLTSFV
jgi:hypothetical protein